MIFLLFKVNFLVFWGLFMDKFGIFNLLNSFLNLSAPRNSDTSNAKQVENPPEQNLLGNLLSSINGKSNGTEQTKQNAFTPNNTTTNAPLTMGMLSTMHAHDQHVKRVQSKNTLKT